jgi:LemA protein
MTTIFIVVIAIILILAIGYFAILNNLNKMSVKVEESLSGIDVALTKRYDVLNKMMDVVKAYTKYEKETLFKTIKLRNNMTMEEENDANSAMNENLRKINVIAENYPELKSSENYKTLQLSIADVEEHLGAARRVYNSNVSYYNQLLVTFPSSMLAKQKGMQPKEFFKAEEEKKKDVKIDLSQD